MLVSNSLGPLGSYPPVHALGCDSLLGFLSRRHSLLHQDLTPPFFLSGFPLHNFTTFSLARTKLSFDLGKPVPRQDQAFF